MKGNIYPCFWFDGKAKEAAELYCSLFPNSKITSDSGLTVYFELNGQTFMGLNGGPMFKPTEAVSYTINCESQEEIDHYWNGLTTLAFSKIVLGIIEKNIFSKGVSHLVPSNTLNKYQLLVSIANTFGRSDINIREFKTGKVVDRTLSTDSFSQNQEFWHLGGYEAIPTINEMINNYASWVGLNISKIQ